MFLGMLLCIGLHGSAQTNSPAEFMEPYEQAQNALMTRDYETAASMGLEALRFARAHQDRSEEVMALNLLGMSWYRQRNLVQSKRYLWEAVGLAEHVQGNPAICETYSNLSRVWGNTESPERIDSSRHYSDLAVECFAATGYNIRSIMERTMAGTLLEDERRFEEAAVVYQRGLQEIRKFPLNTLKDTMSLVSLYGMLAGNNFWRNQLDSSIFYLAQSMDLATAAGNYQVIPEQLEKYAMLLERQGRYPEALAAVRRQHFLIDSFNRENNNALIAEMETKYRLELREATISEQQNTIHTQRTRNWLFGGLALLALVSGGVFFVLSQKLRKRNEQNEFLVKEIHHRTKNNLQVLSSLLSLQTDYIDDPAALDAVTEGRNRVQSIGLLHQQLYTGTELEYVDPSKYFRELGDHLLDTFGREGEINIAYDIDLPQMPVDEAISLGLIANELLTNSMKYAYPKGTEGTIYFELKPNGKQRTLRIRDEGGGEKSTTPGGTGFGRDLVQLLNRKLKGELHEERTPAGWATTVRW